MIADSAGSRVNTAVLASLTVGGTVIAPPEFAPEIFDLTMRGLEAGLRVGDIATFDVRTCEASASLGDVLVDLDLKPFDAIPVRAADRVVGVVERLVVPTSGTVHDHMRRLDEDILVAADVPLKTFIPLLRDEPYRLVVRGTRIEGIVTQSDVHKLPVRLLVFAHITHLEMTMAALIEREFAGDEWLKLLPGSEAEASPAEARVTSTAATRSRSARTHRLWRQTSHSL
jgi:predicted transcriptional regulator